MRKLHEERSECDADSGGSGGREMGGEEGEGGAVSSSLSMPVEPPEFSLLGAAYCISSSQPITLPLNREKCT